MKSIQKNAPYLQHWIWNMKYGISSIFIHKKWNDILIHLCLLTTLSRLKWQNIKKQTNIIFGPDMRTWRFPESIVLLLELFSWRKTEMMSGQTDTTYHKIDLSTVFEQQQQQTYNNWKKNDPHCSLCWTLPVRLNISYGNLLIVCFRHN